MSDIDSQPDLQPPAGLKLPAELVPVPPRRLPPEFDDNIHQKNRKRSTLYLVGSGILCMVLSYLPFVQTIGIYFMPLLILFWIGLGLLLIAVWVWFSRAEINRVAAYVTNSEAGFARVDEMVKVPTMTQNGAVTLKAFVANVALPHPRTGKAVSSEIKSKDFSADAKLAPKFRVGDWVPVVWLNNQFDSTLQIYDFLEPTPENSLDREVTPLWKAAAILAIVAGFIVGIFWAIYSLGRYQPIEFGSEQAKLPVIVGSILGVICTAALWISGRRSQNALKLRNEQAVESGGAIEMEDGVENSLLKSVGMSSLIGFGFIVMGCLFAISGAISINALMDQSPPKPSVVEITQLTETIHKMIFREYKIEYKMQGVEDELELMSTPAHMDTFEVAAGFANVREGYFGWRWVDTIDPVIVDQISDELDGNEPGLPEGSELELKQ